MFIAAPELILMPILICMIIASEKNDQREIAKNITNKPSGGGNVAYHTCSYKAGNDVSYDYDEWEDDDGFCTSSYDDDREENGLLDSLFSEPDHSDDFSIYVNDSGLPTYWNDDGDTWGAPFGGI